MKILYTWLSVALMSIFALTVSAEINVTTQFIVNPSFENGTSYWTADNFVAQSNKFFTKTNGNIYLEKWTDRGKAVGSATIEQVISYLPAGNYRLTVAAQNIQQDDASAAQTGTQIYAKYLEAKKTITASTTVTTINDYSVDFPGYGTDVTIGFKATNATGNWICVDNFRLFYLNCTFELLQTAIANAEAAITAAEKSSKAGIQPTYKTALLQAIENAKAITQESTDEEFKTAAFELAAAHKVAQENADVLYNLKKSVNASNSYAKGTYDTAKAYITTLVNLREQAATILAFEVDATEAEIIALTEQLTSALDQAKASYNSKRNLKNKITSAKKINAGENGKDEYLAAIELAESICNKEDATPEEMDKAVVALDAAMLQYRIDNGTGTAPKATTVTSFLIPAAHGALIRASFSGTGITEKGICWSTEKDPKVTDNRCTDFYTLRGNLYHIKDMEPASVYYARAYAITSSYAVGYGEVVKVVTLPKGGCVGTWNEGAPTEEANKRCREAIQQTMDYLNEWTAIQGFTLTGNYGAGTATADCSYGGWMRIGPNAGNQAIGTVIHETGHGVGVGTHWRWNDCYDTRESQGKYGKWLGSWANKTLHFLENDYGEGVFMTGDAVHGWGANASYDWFVNGADKDTHTPFHYIGGCALLYGLYIDGLCPTWGYANGVPGYTYNFDDSKKYYIKSEDANRGLYDGFLYQRSQTAVSWKQMYRHELDDENAAWYIEYDAQTGYYFFKNAASGRYLSHSSGITLQITTKPSENHRFQLLPGRKDLTINQGSETITVPSFWFTWDNGGNKAMNMGALNKNSGIGSVTVTDFNYSDAGGTMQRYVILSEDELEAYEKAALPTGIRYVTETEAEEEMKTTSVYSIDGRLIQTLPAGDNANNLRLPRGIYMIGGKKVVVR